MRPSPYLVQFLGIIQLPVVDLCQRVSQEIEANPVLELEDGLPFESIEEITAEDETPEDDFFQGLDDGLPLSVSAAGRFEEKEIQFRSRQNWREAVLSKACAFTISSQERDLCEYLLNNVDRSGILTVTLSDAAERFNIGTERARQLLKALQDAGPAGCCSRDVRESLMIRVFRTEGDSLLFKIVSSHLIDAVNKNYRKIAKSLGVSTREIKEEITKLREYSSYYILEEDQEQYVFPEIEVRIEEGQLIVLEISRFVPRLRINKAYLDIARSSRDKRAEEFIKQHISRAKAFLSAIEERKKRLIGLVRFLSEKQRRFVEDGYAYLLPLTLKEAARFLKTSESTISRLSNQKYVQLPWGVVKIKDFFSNPLSYKSETNPETAKALIVEILKQSNGRRPSDNVIAGRLSKMGIELSRRTVNKYRRQIESG